MQIDMQCNRPIPFYFINTGDMSEYTPEIIDGKVRQLYDDGFGGAMLFNCAGNGFDKDRYLTEEFFTMTERFILAAQKYGLKIWVTDGWRCPSGDVGDKVEKRDPSLYQRRLTRNDAGEVEAVKVPWGFPAFEEPESSDLFIELVYEEYHKRLGKYFGNTFEGIFTDADNRRFDAFSQLMMSGNYYPWAKDFAAGFQKEYGYDITAYLGDIVDGKNSRESYDYHCFCEKLYLNWFIKNYQWCKAHGLKYAFHTSDTGPFPRSRCRRSSVFTEGNPFNFFEFSDYPGTDHEFLSLDGGIPYDSRMPELKISRGSDRGVYRNPDFANTKYDLRAKYAGSAAYLYGKAGAVCELFACSHWGATPAEFRRIAAWQLLQGITRFIPHGILHKFFPDGKYNCPPEQHMGTGRSIRQINDFIAKYSFIASQGKFAPGVKVADITEAVRRGEEDVENFFTFTDMLNHAGISYVIVPENDPEAIRTLGDLPELPPRDFTFTGGDLLAMRRELNGEHFLLLCNLWSEEELSGTLEFEGRRVDIALAPGEIAVIGSPYEEFRQRKDTGVVPLAFPAAVEFSAPNRVPFHYNSAFTIAETLETPLKLLVPERFAAGFTYDGTALEASGREILWSEPYVTYTVPGTAGRHSFELSDWIDRPQNLGDITGSTGNNTAKFKEQFYALPVLVDGGFDAELDIEDDFDHRVYGGRYSLQIHDPARCDVTLRPRRKTLDAGSWAKQGQPFYSGSAVYRFDISDIAGNAVLETPYAGVKVEVFADGTPCGVEAFPPYCVVLGRVDEVKVLEIRVTNTLSNEFEEYLAPSGLVNGAFLNFAAN